MPSQSSKNVEP